MAGFVIPEEVEAVGVSEQNINSEDEEEDEEEEEVEPKLKYQRITNDVNNILRKDAASCLAMHLKFMILGTHWGVISVLDHQGNCIPTKEIQAHTTTVNQISLDENGEYFASCSDDGKIIIHGLYSSDCNYQQTFDRPIKAIAIDPLFYKLGTKRRFITGDEKLILHERALFSRLKTTILHEGDGFIRNINWKGQFVAWASDKGVRIYDMNERKIITLIRKDNNFGLRPELYRWNLFWKDEFTLLVGWADTVKVCAIKQHLPAAQDMPTYFVQIVSAFTTDFYISGIAPFGDNLVVLCHTKDEERIDCRPQLRVVSYQTEDYTLICTDVLSIRGFEEYRCNDYYLYYMKDENNYFIISPKDLIVAKPRDADDHISWLIDHNKFQEAMDAVEEMERKVIKLKRHTFLDVGRTYLDHLLSNQQFNEAASLCVKILGDDKTLWEREVFKFVQVNQLKMIAPFLPHKSTHNLSPAIYEMVLNEFLQSDYEGFLNLIQKWSSDIYNIPTVITAVLDKLTYDPNSPILLRCLGKLYTFEKKYDKALAIYLKLGLSDVFVLIREHGLYKSIGEHLEILMILDKEQAVNLCLENIDKISVDTIVNRLEKRHDFLYHFLDRLFAKDSQLAGQYHGLLVKLYAEHDSKKLLSFLKSSNSYPLQEALEICKQYGLVQEQVYLLGRMGNLKQALQLITQNLNDIAAAIEFCKEHDDKDLWEDLIQYSLDKPFFVTTLLNNIGTYIDPIMFIQRIDDKLKIPHLQKALVQILQDYNLQISVREGCKKILVADCFSLQEKLHKHQKKGIAVHDDMTCQACQGRIIAKDVRHIENIIIFGCKHIFHENCLPGMQMDSCTICTTHKRGQGTTSIFHTS